MVDLNFLMADTRSLMTYLFQAVSDERHSNRRARDKTVPLSWEF